MVSSSNTAFSDSIQLNHIYDNIQFIVSNDELTNKTHFFAVSYLIFLLFVLSIFHVFQTGATWVTFACIGGILLFAVCFFMSKIKVNNIGDSVKFEENKTINDMAVNVKSLLRRCELHSYQLKLIFLFYLLLFPFVLYISYDLCFGKAAFNSMSWGLICALMVSGIFWFSFFIGEFHRLKANCELLFSYVRIINQHLILAKSQEH